MKYVSPIVKVIRNKYLIAGVFFLVWMLFFDPKDWGLMRDRTVKLNSLKESEKHLVKEIQETRKELHQLKASAKTIEKYAREKFYMKKENEDLFIVK